MALLFWEGFDSYNSVTDLTTSRSNFYPNWDDADWAAQFSTTNGRFNGGSIRVSDSAPYWGMINTTTASEIYTGRAIYSSGDTGIIAFFGNHTPISPAKYRSLVPDIWIEISGSKIKVLNWSGSTWTQSVGLSGVNVIGTSGASVSYNTWNWIEARCKMSSSNTTSDGIVQVWLNNQLVFSNTSCITIANNSATGYMGTNAVCCRQGGVVTTRNDDIYILDTTGPAPWNTRLGDLRIATVVPNADVGPNQGTPSSGNTHYSVVDESVPNLTDYITFSASATDEGEMFSHTSLPTSNGNDGILATAVVLVGRKTDSGNAVLKLSLQTNNARYNSNTQYLTTSNSYFRQEWITNPNTGLQWSNTDWHSANIGFYVV